MRHLQHLISEHLTCIFVLVAGCNHPLGTPDMTGFAPWERIPEGNGIKYIETAKAGHNRIPTLVALFEYDDQDALSGMITEFQLEPDERLEQKVELFRADEDQFKLTQVDRVYYYPTGDDGYGCIMWVDSQRKQAIIQRMWWW